MTSKSRGVRAGAAAFALGLGIAVSNGAGIAFAVPADSGAGSSPADTPSSSPESLDEKPESAPLSSSEADGADAADEGASSPSAEEDVDTPEDPSTEEEGPAAEKPGAEDTEPEVPDVEAEVDVETPTEPTSDTPRKRPHERVDAPSAEPRPSDSPQAVSENSADDADLGDAGTSTQTTDFATPDTTTEVAPPTVDAGAPVTESTELAAQPVTDVVSNLVAGFAALFGFNGGTTTPGPFGSIVLAAWEWTRRTLFNPGPSVTPVQHVQTDNGEVIGTIGATDPVGGPLTYTVVDAPENGTVTISEDGTFVYRPHVGFAVAGGADSFTVEVSQPGFHINLLNLFGDNGPARTTIGLNVDAVAGAEVGLGTSRGFDIYNASSVPMTYTGYYKSGVIEGGPLPGATIQPGEKFHFELTNYAFSENLVVVQFETVRGQIDIVLDVPATIDGPFSAHATCWSSAGNACAATGTTAIVMDPAGTVIDVPAADAQKQAQILNLLCQTGSSATCSFKSSRSEETQSEPHPVGSAVINNSDTQNSTTLTISDALQESNSIKVAMKEKIEFLVSGEASQEYGYTWQKTSTFTQSITVNLPPHTKGSVTATQPVFRVHGDFTLTLGNSTWILRDVYFDSPNPNGAGEYVINVTPLTGAEIASLPTGLTVDENAALAV
ncbi:hypothetical protein BH11ACT7_BH11ACT7_29650 [soil metagenome]